MAIEKLAETLLEKLRYITKAETVIGEPIQAGESTVIPVSRVSVGFGFGGHQNKGDTSASGGGASVEPVAFLVIRGDDVRIMPITKDSSLVSKIMDIVPDVMNKFSGKKSQGEAWLQYCVDIFHLPFVTPAIVPGSAFCVGVYL